MLRVYQQQVLSSSDTFGDCLRACVATLLQIPIVQLPHWRSEPEWPINFYQWLEERDLARVDAKPGKLDGFSELWGLHIISGPSPRGGCNHTVIGYNGDIFFDPHPTGDGLAGSSKDWKYIFIFPKRPGGDTVVEAAAESRDNEHPTS